ncbi:uncharacterized protein PHACADRAFT_202207 [Phanerochaete carnosa HHB-10118-sp]|uniref:G-protein coupled receptors family 1 profile domain-containing protein n=1 Tax=Phanerochaete carnosa (strain HHB-10118-sp) TaxID=650164 RepID=K5VQD3_PHACS|nr:uncharacterized protein PHACADRAFT_202207 [Phanerochaete carnosa HHB-10118-sp]EKM48940.1 hypothetical protein PHACADRAFT_202207 [Phanerochaete carnosa HHB-10118-sp]
MNATASAGDAGNATASAVPQIPPEIIASIVEGYANGIRTPLGFVLIGTIFGSMLVPILICLFYFSTSTTRRQSVFIMNVIMILFGITIAIWNNQIVLLGILRTTKPVSSVDISAFTVVFGIAPWFADLVLALRLLVVFPPSQTPKAKLAAVFAFPITVKIVRLSCVIAYYHTWDKETEHAGSALQAAETVDYRHSPYTKVEWFLQIFDNFYLSALFILRLYRSQIFNAMSGRRPNDQNRFAQSSSNSLSSRLKFLFWIALGNFVFPVIFNIILIIDLYTDPNYIVNTIFLLFTNYYVSIIGVVFATVWSSSSSYKQQRDAAASSNPLQGSWRPNPNVRTNETLNSPAISSSVQPQVFSPVCKNEDWESGRGSKGEEIPLAVFVEKTHKGDL